ncbi:MAG TPA: MazG family protein [Mycobacteriales bacterium]|nr:MazG family protein [Mycobacteriales bacterium]
MTGSEGADPAPVGAALLQAVAVMDRLRSPGGCPWDAEQTHESLAPYLLEEAYEAFQAIEDGDLDALRDELGDVLLQVLFHARLAEELPAAKRWTVDDVAAGLVAKLERRHPHVFGDVEVQDADDVNRNWEQIKAAERGDKHPVASVPLAAPALVLAAKLQRKAGEAPAGDASVLVTAAERYAAEQSADAAGELLWAAVSVMRAVGIDAEAALRARARRFRDEVLSEG